jgi:hypothetical protein
VVIVIASRKFLQFGTISFGQFYAQMRAVKAESLRMFRYQWDGMRLPPMWGKTDIACYCSDQSTRVDIGSARIG